MNKKWGAVLAFSPAVSLISLFLVIVIGLLAAFICGMSGVDSIDSAIVGIWFIIYFVLIAIAIIVNLASMIVFCVSAYRNTKLEIGTKIFWIMLIISLQFIAIPVYWWKYMKGFSG